MQNNNTSGMPGIYQVFMLILCVYVLLMLIVETFFSFDPQVNHILSYADTGICVLFLIDFIVNLIRYRWSYLKWGWIDLISSIPTVGILRAGRAIRVIRILRLLRGVRSVKLLGAHMLNRRAQGTFAAVAMITIMLVIFGSIGVLEFERGEENSNILTAGDALWWSIVTVTTVGYGDRYPVTAEGRIIAGFLMIAGVGLFGTFTGLIASWFVHPEEKKQDNDLESLKLELKEIKKILMQNRSVEPPYISERSQATTQAENN